MTLTFDLLTLKVVSESRVTWATSVPILFFLVLSVLDFGPMYATDRQTSEVRRAASLNAPPLPWAGYNDDNRIRLATNFTDLTKGSSVLQEYRTREDNSSSRSNAYILQTT